MLVDIINRMDIIDIVGLAIISKIIKLKYICTFYRILMD